MSLFCAMAFVYFRALCQSTLACILYTRRSDLMIYIYLLFIYSLSLLKTTNNNTTTKQIGNGKVKTKEPLEMANKAIAQLKEVVDIASKLE